GRVPANSISIGDGGKRSPTACGAQGHSEPGAREQWRIDAVCQRPQLSDGRRDVILELVHERLRALGIAFRQLLEQPDLYRQGDEVLLRAVVQIAFNPPPLLVSGRNQSS